MCDYFNVLRAKWPHITSPFSLQRPTFSQPFDSKMNVSNRFLSCTQLPYNHNQRNRYPTPMLSQNAPAGVSASTPVDQSPSENVVKNPQSVEPTVRKVSDIRILSRNINGTTKVTSLPTNESELQMYRVLQKANLLEYYDTFISQGGDDVQQLCDADENEFLEIMGLVGMKRPLHVRRLQKMLREWMTNPVQFQQPLKPIYPSQAPPSGTNLEVNSLTNVTTNPMLPSNISHPTSLTSTVPVTTTQINWNAFSNGSTLIPPLISQIKPSVAAPIAISGHHPYVNATNSSNNLVPVCSSSTCASLLSTTLSNGSQIKRPTPMSLAENVMAAATASLIRPPMLPRDSNNIHIANGFCTSPPVLQNASVFNHSQPITPVSSLNPPERPTSGLDKCQNFNLNCNLGLLLDSEIQKIEETAKKRALKFKDFKFKMKLGKQAANKKIAEKIEELIKADHDENSKEWLDQIRQYSAIFGRFCNKNKPDRSLTMYQACVNEAAFQLCRFLPKFLANRDDLLKAARKVVEDSGYKFSKGHSRSQYSSEFGDINENSNSNDSSTSDGMFEEMQSGGSSRTTSRADLEPLPSSPRTSVTDHLETPEEPEVDITSETSQKVYSDCEVKEEDSNDTVCSGISDKHNNNVSPSHKHHSDSASEQEGSKSKINHKRKANFNQDTFDQLYRKRMALEDGHSGLHQQSPQFGLNLTVPASKQ